MDRLTQSLDRFADGRLILAVLHFPHGLEAVLHLGLDLGGDLVTEILQQFLGGVDTAVRRVAGLNQIGPLAVRRGVGLGLLTHPFDLLLRQPGGGGNGDMLVTLAGPILRRDFQDAIGINIESNLNLRNARGAGGMPSRMNLPSDLLSTAMGRSPCRTWISTCVWLSLAVEKI